MENYTDNELAELKKLDQLGSKFSKRILVGLATGVAAVPIGIRPELPFQIIAAIIGFTGMLILFSSIFTAYQMKCFRCPRCKEPWSNPFGGKINPGNPNICFSCGLRRPKKPNFFIP
jgi:hypothetical protein